MNLKLKLNSMCGKYAKSNEITLCQGCLREIPKYGSLGVVKSDVKVELFCEECADKILEEMSEEVDFH